MRCGRRPNLADTDFLPSLRKIIRRTPRYTARGRRHAGFPARTMSERPQGRKVKTDSDKGFIEPPLTDAHTAKTARRLRQAFRERR
jgi:hypothetical protein